MTKPTPQSERVIQKNIRKWLIMQGYEVIKLTTMKQYGSAGWPDLLVLSTASIPPLFLEVKTEFGQLTPLQMQRIKGLVERRFKVQVVRSLDDTKEAVAEWLK